MIGNEQIHIPMDCFRIDCSFWSLMDGKVTPLIQTFRCFGVFQMQCRTIDVGINLELSMDKATGWDRIISSHPLFSQDLVAVVIGDWGGDWEHCRMGTWSSLWKCHSFSCLSSVAWDMPDSSNGVDIIWAVIALHVIWPRGFHVPLSCPLDNQNTGVGPGSWLGCPGIPFLFWLFSLISFSPRLVPPRS